MADVYVTRLANIVSVGEAECLLLAERGDDAPDGCWTISLKADEPVPAWVADVVETENTQGYSSYTARGMMRVLDRLGENIQKRAER